MNFLFYPRQEILCVHKAPISTWNDGGSLLCLGTCCTPTETVSLETLRGLGLVSLSGFVRLEIFRRWVSGFSASCFPPQVKVFCYVACYLVLHLCPPGLPTPSLY